MTQNLVVRLDLHAWNFFFRGKAAEEPPGASAVAASIYQRFSFLHAGLDLEKLLLPSLRRFNLISETINKSWGSPTST